MKRILLASAALIGTAVSAQAADLAVKAPYYKAPVVAVYNWTGFYVGVNAGAGIGRDRVSHFYNGDSVYQSPQGGFGGAQIGYNWQADSLLGTIVYGVEADIQGGDLSGGGATLVGPLGATVYSTKSDWFGTVRGRVGIATGPVLSYFTGGYAYGNVKSSITEGGIPAFSQSKTEGGWTIGSGVEAALGGNWTGKLEYLYLNLGDRTNVFGPGFQYTNNELRENIFRVGLNYRIGGNAAYAPIPASNWTGWYLGGNVGSGTGRDRTSLAVAGLAAPERFSLNPDGINGGGQIGYNWQSVNWVYGIETDIQASSQRDNKTAVLLSTAAYDAKLPWFGTVRGRVGYSVGSTLFYATGGFAYGGVKTKISTGGVEVANFSKTQTGWTAGAGIETPFKLLGLFGPSWTTKTEYLYVDLGNSTNLFAGGLAANSTNVTEHIFRTGLNYHFNSPIVAKY
jgi:outer membrane immunogenic protein